MHEQVTESSSLQAFAFERDCIILMHLSRFINDHVAIDDHMARMNQSKCLGLGVFGAFTNKFI